MKTIRVYCRPYAPCAVLRNGIDPPWIGLTQKIAGDHPLANRRLGVNRDPFSEIVWGLVASLVLSLPALSVANPLDGMRFIGPTGENGEEAFGDEELTFYDGKLASVDCARWGFGEGLVTTRTADDGIHFAAETRSETYGKIIWEAVYTWCKEGWFVETVREYWFTGTHPP